MVEADEMKIRTFEELLWDKIVKMSLAKEEGNDYFFDELLDETGMFIKLVPEMYTNFEESKKELDKLVDENLQALKATIVGIEDDITRELIAAQKTSLIKWEYRSDMLEVVLNLLNYFQMIPFANPNIADMTGSALPEETAESTAEPYEERPEPIQPPQQPQQEIPSVERKPSFAPSPPKQPEEYPNIRKGIKLRHK